MWKEILKNLGTLILGFMLGIIVSIPSCNKETSVQYVPVHDTITIKKDSIIYKTRPVNVYFHDTLYVKESGDTVKLDSLPITEYVYQDTIKTDSTSTEIKINYHGFDAGIDSLLFIHTYYERKETIIQPPKKVGWVWAVGPSIGYSITINPTNGQLNHGISGGLTIMMGIGGTIK